MNAINVDKSFQTEALFGRTKSDMKIPSPILANFVTKHFRIAPIWLCIKGLIQVRYLIIGQVKISCELSSIHLYVVYCVNTVAMNELLCLKNAGA